MKSGCTIGNNILDKLADAFHIPVEPCNLMYLNRLSCFFHIHLSLCVLPAGVNSALTRWTPHLDTQVCGPLYYSEGQN